MTEKKTGLFLEDEDVVDQLDDLGSSDMWKRGAALTSTDWTAETILSQLHKNNIDLEPNFQRRSAWTDIRQSLFIESLMIRVPIPQLVLAERSERYPYIVIDGKQRLLAILRFGNPNSKLNQKPLRLRGLKILDHLNGKTYADMKKSKDFLGDITSFENSSIRTVVICNWEHEKYLYEAFLRINSGSVPLSPQELRQALHPGKFSDYIRDKSAESKQIHLAMNISKPDFRMRDAEILLRYFAYRNFMIKYRGNLKAFLDETTKIVNDEWKSRSKEIEHQFDQMEEAFIFTKKIFGDNYMCKSNGKIYENRRNRAVMDIMLHYFSCPKVRNALKGSTKEVEKGFIDLCKNEEFRLSFEQTTKSIEMNRIRFNMWGDMIKSLSGLNIDHMRFRVRKR